MANKKRKINVKISEDDYPSKEKIWANLYRGRDFELSSFWQKSIFLFSLLTLCFTGYGALMLKTAEKNVDWIYLHEYMLAISIVGIVLSYIWIAMSKGSKAWYEVYEKTIYQLETELFRKENDVEKYIEGHYVNNFKDTINEKLLNNFDGGPFSPSKINILIGNILFIIWILCASVCIGNIFCEFFEKTNLCPSVIVFVLLLICLCVVIFRFSKFLKSKVKSRVLSSRVNELENDMQNK